MGIQTKKYIQFSSFQLSHSVVSTSLRPYELQHTRPPCPSLTLGVHSSSLSIESVMPSSHLILCCPLLLLPPIPPSIRVFSNESTLHKRWPKYWSFSFSIIPSKEMTNLVMTNLDSILKTRDITLSTTVCLVKAMVFPVVMYDVRVSL